MKIMNMSSKVLLLILIMVSFLYSCESDVGQVVEIKTKYMLEPVNISVDTLIINIDSTLSGYNISSCLNDNEELILCGYNKMKHYLDFISLTKGKVLKSIKLEKEGPLGVGTVDGLYYFKHDSIFVFSSDANYIYLLNEEGNIKTKWDIVYRDKKNKNFYRKNIFSLTKPNAFYYSSKDNSLFIRNYNYEYSQSKNPQEYYKHASLMGEFSLFNNQPSLLPIYYSKELRDNYVGLSNDPEFTFISREGLLENIIYIFPASASIYVFNRFDKKTTAYIPDKREINTHIDYLPWTASDNSEELIKAANTDLTYEKIIPIYTSKRELYAQFYIDKLKGEPNKLESHVNRTRFLSIYDKDFNCIFVKKLPRMLAGYHRAINDKNNILVPFLIDDSKMAFLKISILE